MKVVECVPNFSEGRNQETLFAIGTAIASYADLRDQTADVDHNRSVFTFTGDPGAVVDAAMAAIRVAAERIDLTCQAGVHPRIGAADVVPFVPLEGITLDECASLARGAGKRIWDELAIPVYLYEAAALRPECVRLENIRKHVSTLPPDFGTHPHPTAGSCVTGARKFLIAWNINLRTADLIAARAIANDIREAKGGLRSVKALGLPLDSRGQAQVSINLVDFEVTPLHVVFEAVAALCRARGIEIAGSELIGMIPAAALAASEGHDLKWENLTPARILTC